MYEIALKAASKSRAKILGLPVKSYIEGKNYVVSFQLTNIGNNIFPGGRLSVSITWPNGQFVVQNYLIPPLDPNSMHTTSDIETGAMSRGYALFIGQIIANDQKPVTVHSPPGRPIKPPMSFYSIIAKSPEEIYEFWGMMIAAISLISLALEKVIFLINWLINGMFFEIVQLGVPTLLFIISFFLLHLSKKHFKKMHSIPWIFSILTGVVFSFSIYHPIHEGIHYLFAKLFGAKIFKVVWWSFNLTIPDIESYVTADFSSISVWFLMISLRAPFLLLTTFLLFAFLYFKTRKPHWKHFVSFPFAYNLFRSSHDMGSTSDIGFILAVGFLCTYSLYYARFFKFRKEK